MRDVKAAMLEGHERAYELGELLIDVDGLIDDSGGSEDDGVDDTSDGDTPEVASGGRSPRMQEHAEPSRPVEGRMPRSTAASALDSALDLLAGEDRAKAIAELDLLRMHSMGAPRVANAPKARKHG